MRQSEYTEMMQRDDDSLGPAELTAAYERGIDDLRSAVAGMTHEQVLARPVPGKWSTIECVGHLADAEVFFTDRIVRTIALDRPRAPLAAPGAQVLLAPRGGPRAAPLPARVPLLPHLPLPPCYVPQH